MYEKFTAYQQDSDSDKYFIVGHVYQIPIPGLSPTNWSICRFQLNIFIIEAIEGSKTTRSFCTEQMSPTL